MMSIQSPRMVACTPPRQGLSIALPRVQAGAELGRSRWLLLGLWLFAAACSRGKTVSGPAEHTAERLQAELRTGRDPNGACKPGNLSVGTACITDEGPCAFIDCGGHGTCAALENGGATCRCDEGYQQSALECLPQRRECFTRPLDQFSAFPTKNQREPGTWAESDCIRVTSVTTPLTVAMAYDRGEVSLNGGQWAKKAVIREGDEVRLRGEAHTEGDGGNTIYMVHGEDLYGIFEYRTANTDRAPEVFAVGPRRKYKQLGQVREMLRAGDVVELDGDATYEPVQFSRAGTPELPIRIRGLTVNGKRPIIAGGSVALGFRRGHHYIVENVEVTGASETCLRVEADGLRFIDVFVHDCPRHGVLGADTGSGTLVFDRGEITRCGGELEGESLKHGLYVATDYQSYPGSKLKLIHSFVHDNGGNAIKSRAERTEVYFNWLDSRSAPGSYYALELIGFQEFQEHGLQHSDVVGNVLVGRGSYVMRIGGDGSGESRGRVRLVNNTFLVSPALAAEEAPIIRVTGALDALWLANNAFYAWGQPGAPLRLWRHDQAQWTTGEPRAQGIANWVPERSSADPGYFPVQLEQTRRGAANPGLAATDDPAQLDVALVDSSELRGAGVVKQAAPAFEFEDSLTRLWSRAPHLRPRSGATWKPTLRETQEGSSPSRIDIGAQ